MLFKRFSPLALLGFTLLLAGCGAGGGGQMSDANSPEASRGYPKIPMANVLEAEMPDAEEGGVKLDIEAEILDKPAITKEILDRGWYYVAEEKLYGTPDSWVLAEKDGQPTWMSPVYMETAEQEAQKKICEESKGTYRLACTQSISEECDDRVAETTCDCPEGTAFHSWENGCLIFDEEAGKFPLISPEQLKQGYYSGLKLLGTPAEWVPFAGRENPKSYKDEPGWRTPYL